MKVTEIIGKGLLTLTLFGLLGTAFVVQATDTVPYKSNVSGKVTYTDTGGVIEEETGIATHLGTFTMSGATDEHGIMWITITAANNDKLFAVVVYVSPSMDTVEINVYDGTGRFEHATGDITAYLTVTSVQMPSIYYTAIGTGTITTVGASKQ